MSRNRLAAETSPYLLQHKDNPVHWWAWGPDALEEAKNTQKPILLSIGYAACHWCYVMAHESFEDQETADVMNELFVNIKVDREERPDIDAIYMNALHAMNEQGGWPLTMFLDSAARPFWGGTYFPKKPNFGRPGFIGVMKSISKVFKDDPDKVAHNATLITKALKHQPSAGHKAPLTDALMQDLTIRMARACDSQNGGIQGAPKFPQWTFFWLLWKGAIRYQDDDAKQAVLTTLTHICQGGIYDHLAGGFSRYSVDERWLAPHFEKMLYDNALLIDLLTEACRETKDPLYKIRIEQTITWLEREMITDGGGFSASLDADSEGVEGKFYVWTADEITSLLGKEHANFFFKIYDVTPEGNWEDKNILNRLHSLELLDEVDEKRLKALREKLLEARTKRIRPGLDDKILADWNGLMIASLARSGLVFHKPEWIDLASNAFNFIKTKMTGSDGRLRHAYRAGRLSAMATASDYANMILAAIRLYEATGEKKYLNNAVEWSDTLHAHYWIPDRGRFATTADDTKDIIARLSPGTDDATPCANAIQLSNLSALALLTGDDRYREQAAMMLDSFSPDIAANLIAHTGLLGAAMDLMSASHIVIVQNGKGNDAELKKALFEVSLPGALQTFTKDSRETAAPWAEGKTTIEGKPAAYVCMETECAPPVTNPDDLTKLLKQKRTVA